MKVNIKQNVLSQLLAKGTIAALSDEAQQDTSTLSLLIKSVKITVDKDFTVESGTNLIAVKYSVLAKEEDGIDVKEPGCIVVPADEFVKWVSAQNEDSIIRMELQKLPNPEVVSTATDESGEEKGKSVKKIGIVKFACVKKGTSKTSGKWDLVCYDPDDVTTVNYGYKADKQFEVKGGQLTEALNNIGFAALTKDWEKILDSVSIQVYKGELYFATTDMLRCALYKVPKTEGVEIHSEKSLLIPKSLMELSSKIIEKDDKISFSYNEDQGRVYLKQPRLNIRLASAEKTLMQKFPPLKVLLEKEYSALAEMNKACLNELLVNAAVVNSSSALFAFNKEDKSIIVKAISEDGKQSPTLKKADNVNPIKDVRVVWGVKHLIEGLKVLKSDDIVLEIPKNFKSVKITSKSDINITYFAMTVENPKYNEEAEKEE